MDDKIMPAVFVGHGSPMDAIGVNPARTGWKQMNYTISMTSYIFE